MFFAAWLRSAYTSPCEWLKEEEANDCTQRFLTTLGFWLWLAGAPISPPLAWDGSAEVCANQTALPPLKWERLWDSARTDFDPDGFDFFEYDSFSDFEDMQDLAGHLRNEVHSLESRRTVRRRGARRRPEALTEHLESDKRCGFKKVVGGVRPQHSQVARRIRDTHLLGDEL